MTTVLGVIGGIGSGKSAVSHAFSRLGALVLDADALAHEVLTRSETLEKLSSAFGPDVIGADGQVNRKALAGIVFGKEHEARRQRLNDIIHPAVRVSIDAGLAQAREDKRPLVILDVPLLLESKYRADCDAILYIKADDDTRRARVAVRGWSPSELARREASQTSLAEKEDAADMILVNEGDLDQLEAEVKRIHDRIVEG